MPSTESLAQLSDNLVYSAIAVYALAMLCYAALTATRARHAGVPHALVSAPAAAGTAQGCELSHPPAEPTTTPGDHTRLAAIATALTILAFGFHLGSVGARGLAVQRAPWGNMYEFALVAALTVAGTYLIFLRRQPVREFGVWITGIVVLTLGLAVTVLYTSAGALVPVLNSYWLVIHVAAAIISGGVFTLGVIAVLLYRVRVRFERRTTTVSAGVLARYGSRLPSSASLQRISHGAHLFAFPIWTFAVIAGAIWAENSWGRYWGWDPKETWAFITWVLYAAYLHAEATPGWRGTKATWFAGAGYLAFVFNFFGVNMWITGLHSYAGI